MEVGSIRALRGPNRWCRATAIEAVITCTASEIHVQQFQPDLLALIAARLPAFEALAPEPAAAPLSMAHIVQRLALALQLAVGCPVAFGRTLAVMPQGVYLAVFEYSEEEVGRLALRHALGFLQAVRTDAEFDLAQALDELARLDEDIRPGPSTGSIMQAASARRIPLRRLTRGSLVQMGWGKWQRRIQAAETDRTSAVAEAIAQDKDLTKTLLDAVGVPVPKGVVVSDVKAAWAAANELDGPVVIKPYNGNQGRGVRVNITQRDELVEAFHAAAAISGDVIVEQYIPGHDFRLLIVGDRMVAAARRDPPRVVGDGVLTVRELVAAINSDPRRSDGHATSLTRISLDEHAAATLARQNMHANSVPAAGTVVALRDNANLSTGGSATDVTDEVHPELAAMAVLAARTIGLDICGVDLVAENVHAPLATQRAGIVEVNAAPGLRMHLQPSYGKSRAVGEAIVSHMFASGASARVPLVAVTGVNGKTTTTRLIAHLFASAGNRVGMTNSDGVYIGRQRIDVGDCSGPRSARRVLMHPEVDAAVFETARGGMLREGLAFDECDVAVVTNIGQGDHLGLDHIHTVAELAAVKSLIVKQVATEGAAVLNAADPLVAEMAALCPGDTVFFAADAGHPVLAAHRAQGRRVVYREGDFIWADDGKQRHRVELKRVPLTLQGQIAFQVENVMAATAAAWVLGIPWSALCTGLETYVSDAASTPGRFNRFDYQGATLIADYAHNIDAIQALSDAVKTMPARRRYIMISGAGDRRDADLQGQTRIVGDVFDEVVLYEDQCLRGRPSGSIMAVMRQGLAQASRTTSISEVHGEFAAIERILARLQPGDVCVLLLDQVDSTLEFLLQRARPL